MRFGRWYPLSEAAQHAPAAAGVLQLRVAQGLIDYPSGKSAMVHYACVPDVRAAALTLATQHAGLWCRHLDLEGEDVDLAAFHAKLVDDFVRRFGRAPSL